MTRKYQLYLFAFVAAFPMSAMEGSQKPDACDAKTPFQSLDDSDSSLNSSLDDSDDDGDSEAETDVYYYDFDHDDDPDAPSTAMSLLHYLQLLSVNSNEWALDAKKLPDTILQFQGWNISDDDDFEKLGGDNNPVDYPFSYDGYDSCFDNTCSESEESSSDSE